MSNGISKGVPIKSGVPRSDAEIRESIQGPADFARAFDVSRETTDRLVTYEQLLRKWQPTINLVAPKTLAEIWQRHFADCAQLLRFGPASGDLHWLDVGTGAGFPGLVVGIFLADRVGCRLTLMESDTRKAAFLREVVRATGLNRALAVDIVAERIESPANQTRVGLVDVVSARALAPLPKLLDLVRPYFGPQTVGLFLKGRELSQEIAEAERSFEFAYEIAASLSDASGRVLVVRRVRAK